MHGGLVHTDKNSMIRKQQEELHNGDHPESHWSPHNEMDDEHHTHHGGSGGAGVHHNGGKTYYTTKCSGVDGIVGKLGRLEAMILAQSSMGKKKK